jgi:peptide/nickel transport system ATP-binding protein
VTAMLEVENLRVSLTPAPGAQPTSIVRGVSFSVPAGGRLGLVGESGCGKTTTLMAVSGLLSSSAVVGGHVRVCGQEQLDSPKSFSGALRRRDVGVVLQGSMNALNPVRRVAHQIKEALRPEVRTDRQRSDDRCSELLDRVGLPSKVSRSYPHELSGGMRQRVCIAIALAGEPRLLLADEPTTALDTVVQARIIELLDQLCMELHLALVVVSHDLRLASDFCDTIAVMYAGRIVEYGPSAKLSASPRHPYTQLLFVATPTVKSRKEDIKSIPGAPPDMRLKIDGCPFYDRCPERERVCRMTPPPAVVADDELVACHLRSR